MYWQGCGKAQDWRGKFGLLWAFSLCNLKLLSAWEMLLSSSAIALLYLSHKCFGQQQKCWRTVELFPTIWATVKGNGKYGVILREHEIADLQFDKADAADAELGWMSTSIKAGVLQKPLATARERSAAEGIKYAAFHFRLQKHVGETCAIALLFMPPSHLPKADYRKLPVNPKMQWLFIKSSTSTLKINPVVWGVEGISLVLPQMFHKQISVSTNHHLSPLHRGVTQRTRLKLGQTFKTPTPC